LGVVHYHSRLVLVPWITLDYDVGVLFPEQTTSDAMCVVDESPLTIADVARFLNVTDITDRPLAISGRIPAFKGGWAWRFREAEIRNWLEERRQPDAAGAKKEAKRSRRLRAK